MRIGIIGAGALGGTFAALLVRAGHDAAITARGDRLTTIATEGIRLTGGFGDVHAVVKASEQLTERPDLALVCTKAHDAEAAIAANADVLDGAPVIVVQNGLEGVDTARRLLPHSECFGALSMIAANSAEAGIVNVTTPAPTYLGRGSGRPDSETQRLASLLSGAAPVTAIGNFEGAQWTKLLVNMLNAAPAITGRSVQETIGDPRLRRIVTASMRETVRVGSARGVRFGAVQGLGDRRLRLFARLPLVLGGVLPWLIVRRMGSVPNPGSTLQSIRRGQSTEIDFLNGAVVRAAEAAGRQAPVNAAITTLVHEVERTGTFLGFDEAVARLQL